MLAAVGLNHWPHFLHNFPRLGQFAAQRVLVAVTGGGSILERGQFAVQALDLVGGFRPIRITLPNEDRFAGVAYTETFAVLDLA